MGWLGGLGLFRLGERWLTRCARATSFSFPPLLYTACVLTLVRGFCPVSALSLQNEIEMLKLQLDLLQDLRHQGTRFREGLSELGEDA